VNPITARPASDVAAPEQATPRRSTVTHLTWAVPVVVAAALGLIEIGVPQLWRDELASWSAASRTVPQLWAMVHNIDAVLGLYYFGLHLWMAVFGNSATALRLPSVIAMAAAAGVVALIGRRLGGVTAGLASGLVFALVPSVSRYAQETRPYAFAMFFAALATLMFLRAVERPNWSRWAIYGGGARGRGRIQPHRGMYCIGASEHPALGLPPAHRADWRRRHRRQRQAAARQPVRVRLAAAARDAVLRGPRGRYRPSIAAGDRGDTRSRDGRSAGSPHRTSPSSSASPAASGRNCLPPFPSLPRSCCSPWRPWWRLPTHRRRSIAWYSLALAIVPIVTVWLLSRGSVSYWTYRYMLFTIAGWSVGAGLCIAYLAERLKLARLARLTSALSPRFTVAAVLVAVVGLLGIHDQLSIRQNEAHNLWAYPEMPSNGQPVDYQAAATVVAANARPGDGIVYQVSDQNHYQVDTSIAYYLRGKSIPTPVFQAQSQVQANNLQPVECIDPSACITGTPRIWVVYVNHLAPDPFSALTYPQESFLQTLGYLTQRSWQENGITVALLTIGG